MAATAPRAALPAQVTAGRRVLSRLFASLALLPDDALRQSVSTNPLRSLGPPAQKLFMALHVLYPNELLPALDLLDRGLVTRLRAATVSGLRDDVRSATLAPSSPSGTGDDTERRDERESDHPPAGHARTWEGNAPPTASAQEKLNSHDAVSQVSAASYLYYVRSSRHATDGQARQSHSGRSYDPLATHYEVRLNAWNCSCPPFAFAAFPPETEQSVDGCEAWHGFTDVMESDKILGEYTIGGVSEAGLGTPMCKHLLSCLLTEYCPLLDNLVEERNIGLEELAGWAGGWGG